MNLLSWLAERQLAKVGKSIVDHINLRNTFSLRLWHASNKYAVHQPSQASWYYTPLQLHY
jgi:hypothetical protein